MAGNLASLQVIVGQIDKAPKEWIPALLTALVKRCASTGAYSNMSLDQVVREIQKSLTGESSKG